MMIAKHWHILVFMVLLLAAFYPWHLDNPAPYLDESTGYTAAAKNLAENRMLYAGNLEAIQKPGLFTKVSPAYPFLLALSPLAGKNFVSVIILQLILAVISVMIMARIFRFDLVMDGVAGVLLLLMPLQFAAPYIILPDAMLQFTIMLMAWAIWSYLRFRHRKFLWTYQFLLLLAVLLKPEMFLFAIPNFIIFLVLYIKKRRRIDLVSSLLPLVFLVLFAGVNQQRTGYFHISSIRQETLVENSLYYFDMSEYGRDSAIAMKSAMYDQCPEKKDLQAYSKCINREAYRMARAKLPDYLLFQAKRAAAFFLGPLPVMPEQISGYLMPEENVLLDHRYNEGLKSAIQYLARRPFPAVAFALLVILFNFIKIIGFTGFLLNRSVRLEFRLFLLFLVLTVVTYSAPSGASRDMLSVALLVLGAAAFQYVTWLRKPA